MLFSFSVVIAKRSHPFPSRTRKLSSFAPMVLRGRLRGRVGRRRNLFIKPLVLRGAFFLGPQLHRFYLKWRNVVIGHEHIEIQKLQGHHCFACGTANPIGLNLQFYRRGDTVCSDIILGKNYEGWENMVHGGILSTLLDEVMSWTVIYFKRTFFVTRKIEVKFIKPVLIGTSLTVRGKLADTPESRKIKVTGEILNDQDRILVRGSGEFVLIPEENLPSVSENLKDEMKLLFDRLNQSTSVQP